MTLPLLPLIVLLPAAAAFLAAMLPKRFSSTVAKLASLAVLLLVIGVVYQTSAYGLQSVSFGYPYIQALGITFSMSVTQITQILAVMTAVVFFAASLVGDYFISQNRRLYNFIFLVSEGSCLGVFLASNMFLFFVFWEVSEIAMFFIIFLYGGINRRYAAVKFIIYSIISSLLLLMAIMLMYSYSSPHTFDIASLEGGALQMPQYVSSITFFMLLVSFMIKMPVFPLHTWLPDAHTEAPATGSMVLAGVLLKFGGYGLLIALTIFSQLAISHSAAIASLFAFSAIYAAVVAIKRSNLKRLIAYTSIVDMGIVAFGLMAMNSSADTGAVYAMLSHGLAISLLFMLSGMLDKEFGTLVINNIKGVYRWSRTAAYLFLGGIFGIVGLPLTSGFVADIMLFSGAVGSFGTTGIIPLFAVIIVGAYMFWLMERSFFGERISYIGEDAVLSKWVLLSSILLIISTVLLGILPMLLVH